MRGSIPPEGEPAEAPGWLVTLARKRPAAVDLGAGDREHPPPNGGPGGYGAAALDREIAALAALAPGGRNAALNRASFRLHQLVAGGELDHHDVVERLVEACHRNGLVKDDGLAAVMATIRSGATCRPAASALAIGCRMSAPDLRPYQREVIEQFHGAVAAGKRRIILVAPTGSGQDHHRRRHHHTTRARRSGARAGASARDHRADQPRSSTRAGFRMASFRPAFTPRPLELVQVASIQTLWVRSQHTGKMDLPPADLLVIDECHHARRTPIGRSSRPIPTRCCSA